MLRTLARLAALSVVMLGGLTAVTLADDAPATTTGQANLRLGPGKSFPIVAILDPGSDVTVHACTQTWCAVTTDDDDNGFVAKTLLDFDVGPTPSDAEVCVYQGLNFSDANFCVAPGNSSDQIPGSFNNAIESILITGDASIEVCTGANMSGVCDTFDSSVKKLPSTLRDRISSYAVTDGSSPPPDDDDNNSNLVIQLN